LLYARIEILIPRTWPFYLLFFLSLTTSSKLDNRIKETTVVHQIFGGYFQSQVKCMKCGYESNTFETYLDVSLDIKGADNVQKAFRDYTTPEILNKGNQYKCEK
jgi:ubiquitin carboxyl-terminal hydrolase 36/42